MGAFRTGQNPETCYEQILAIPVDKFPTSIIDMTSCLDEAASRHNTERSSSPDAFASSVVVLFGASAQKREQARLQAAKDKTETLALAREKRRRERDEIKSHKTAIRIAAVQEREIQVKRRAELDRCRSEAYLTEVRRAENEKKHHISLAQAAVYGKNEARFEQALKSARSEEECMLNVSSGGSGQIRRRANSKRPNCKRTGTTGRNRCAKNAKMLRDERARMVSQACDALRLANKHVRNAMEVPYPEPESQQKMNKGRVMVLAALSDLEGLVD